MKNLIRLTITIIFTLVSLSSRAQHWITLNSGGTNEWLRGVYFFNEDTGLVVGNSGIILRTTDGGTNWNSIPSGTFEELLSVTFYNQTGLITGTAGTLLKSTDGGLSWTDKSSGGGIHWHEAQLLNEDTAYLVGEGATAKTIDGGDSLIFLTTGTFSGRVSLFFVDVNLGFVAGIGDDDAIMRTLNGGDDWTFIHDNVPNEFSSVFFTDPVNGFVCSSFDGSIKRTNNAGNSWQPVNSNTTLGLNSIKFPTPSIGYIAGGYPDRSIIIGTTDGGATWHPHNTNSTSPLFDIFFVNENLGYAVGMDGTILKTANGAALGITTPARANFSIDAFPNPVTDYLTIESEPQATLEIILTDIAGHTISRVWSQGNGSIDMRDLPAGAYFIYFNRDQFTETRKIIKE